MVVALVFLTLLFVSCGLNQMSSHIGVIKNRDFLVWKKGNNIVRSMRLNENLQGLSLN